MLLRPEQAVPLRFERVARRAWLVGLVLLGVVAPVWAHGPAPAALEVLSADEAGPILVRTNIGLALARDDGAYAYICPSRWDRNERALALSVDGRAFVQSAGVAYRARATGCGFEPVTDEDVYLTAMTAFAGGALLVLEPYPEDPDPAHSLLRLVDGDPALAARLVDVQLEGAVDGVRSEADTLWVAGHLPRPFVATLDREGSTELVFSDAARAAERWVPRAVDSDAGAVWVLETLADGLRLLRVTPDGPEEGPTHQIVHGPVRLGGAWVALFDGVLHRWDASGWVADGERPWTCLREEAGQVYACAFDRIVALDDAGETAWFSMSQLAAPEPCADPLRQRDCQADWAHFGGESGWLDTAPATEPDAPRRVPGGCAVSPGR